MKPVRKGECPASLAAYAAAHPGATWRDMRRSDRHPVYDDIREQLLLDQGGLCAYCECGLSRRNVQVEHFVPRSDASGGPAGQLDWDNLLAVCSGGAAPEREDGAPLLPRRSRAHLSCGERKRDKSPDRFLNPLRMPPFPAAYRVNRRLGSLEPNEDFCRAHPELHAGRAAASTRALLQGMADELNLNCARLCAARLAVMEEYQNMERAARESGQSAAESLPRLARRMFGRPWPAYFTTLRFCLGRAAEEYLRAIDFKG